MESFTKKNTFSVLATKWAVEKDLALNKLKQWIDGDRPHSIATSESNPLLIQLRNHDYKFVVAFAVHFNVLVGGLLRGQSAGGPPIVPRELHGFSHKAELFPLIKGDRTNPMHTHQHTGLHTQSVIIM